MCYFIVSTEFTLGGIDYSIEISSHCLRSLLPKRLQMKPTIFKTSYCFQYLSPGVHFGIPWLFWGSIFACLGTLYSVIMIAGDAILLNLTRSGIILAVSGHRQCNFRSFPIALCSFIFIKINFCSTELCR